MFKKSILVSILTFLILGLVATSLPARIVREPWDTDKAGFNILDIGTMDADSFSIEDYLDLEATTEPSAPTAGDVRFWATGSTAHLKTNEAKATISLDPTDGGLGIVRTEDELNLVVNAYYDEASGNWYRIDESKDTWRIKIGQGGTIEFTRVTAGTGPISWSVMFGFGFGGILSSGKIRYIESYSQATEPDITTDSVALWEDTGDNRWWLIWDEGGTQYKVGFENASGELQWTPIWQEQRAHITQFYAPAANNPAQSEIGVTPVLLFDAASDEWVYYEWEVPENYYAGSDFKIRFYWAPTDANAGDVVWGIEYTIITPENDEVLTAATTTQTVTDSTQSLANELLRTDFITISGTGVQPGDIISMRVYRDADNAADDYGADAALIHLGLYFKVDRNGVASL